MFQTYLSHMQYVIFDIHVQCITGNKDVMCCLKGIVQGLILLVLGV